MPPPEVNVTCPGCNFRTNVPISAVRRNQYYCPQCGKNIPLEGVHTPVGDTTPGRAKPKRSSNYSRRR